jgi:hypothetical protein
MTLVTFSLPHASSTLFKEMAEPEALIFRPDW